MVVTVAGTTLAAAVVSFNASSAKGLVAVVTVVPQLRITTADDQ